MHVDMDAFFASVEQFRNHPELIGRPVCVGHDPRRGSGRGVVRAASYEARAFGIRSGMPVSQAYRLCPDAVFVPGRFADYVKASEELISVLKRYADQGVVRKASIDEAFIDVTERVGEYATPFDLAAEVQEQIRLETSLPASVGLAPNMTVAKIATSTNKPKGLTMVGPDREDVIRFLSPLPLVIIPGVGPKSAARLDEIGFKTIGDIQRVSASEMYTLLGRWGIWLHQRALGIDERPVLASGDHCRKSISKDRTFMEDVDGWDEGLLRSSVVNLCERIAARVREKGLAFRTVTVRVRYSDFTTIQKSRSLRVATADLDTLKRLALALLDLREHGRPVRMIGVKVSGLEDSGGQTQLVDMLA